MQDDTTTAAEAMRQRWLEAAALRLAQGGIEAVKIMPLAKALGQTRTGFYWYFKDRAALLEAVLEQWELRTTVPLMTRAQADAGSVCDAVFNVMDCWVQPDLFDA
ncbi:MAG: TetR/AcrR family transcriptional regulator, partial [Paracoccaceae bacterium]